MDLRNISSWKFMPDAVEGCEIECPMCKKWTTHKDWKEFEGPCPMEDDQCEHTCLRCPKCEEDFDIIYDNIFFTRLSE